MEFVEKIIESQRMFDEICEIEREITSLKARRENLLKNMDDIHWEISEAIKGIAVTDGTYRIEYRGDTWLIEVEGIGRANDPSICFKTYPLADIEKLEFT